MKIIGHLLTAIGTIGLFVSGFLFSEHKNSFYCLASFSGICVLSSVYFYCHKSLSGIRNPMIIISLIKRFQYGFRFIIENTSDEDAYNINIDFKLKQNQPFPIQRTIYNNTFPIQTIFGKAEEDIATILNPTSDFELYTLWNWQNKKGKTFSREGTIKLSSNQEVK